VLRVGNHMHERPAVGRVNKEGGVCRKQHALVDM
jgi:hypothetical protein